jgi:hypothetical protein
MSHPQLKLIHSTEHTPQDARMKVGLPNASAAVERVFQHWVDFCRTNHKTGRRRPCALGPDRRKLISRALAMYDEETLFLAIEGCSNNPHNLGDNDRNTVYTDIELILRNEGNIERFADQGEAWRAEIQQKLAVPASNASEAVPLAVDPAVMAEQKRQLRELIQGIKAGRA